jgi:dolichyl-phosphate beta-glucosyltransferase
VSAPYLSVVIPAYNEERRLPFSLQRVRDYLEGKAESYEVVVVDDGSTDNTVGCVRDFGSSRVTLLSNDVNRGKGYSVRRGMLLARGEYRLMCDADLSTPIEETERLLAALKAGADVAIGSRAATGARIEQHQPWYRENLGRLFNFAVRMVALSGISDTQCGFKLFTGCVAEDIFTRAKVAGFSFDVEALFLARRAGYRIVEIPVVWRNDAATRVTPLKGAGAFLDLLRIRLAARLGRYGAGGSRPSG